MTGTIFSDVSDVNSLYGVIGGVSGCVLVLLIVSVTAVMVCLLQHQKSGGTYSTSFLHYTCINYLIW